MEKENSSTALGPTKLGTFALICVMAVGIVLRLAIVTRRLDVIDRLFVPDDTYYTLTIARSLAGGLGLTVDGVRQTNGFQPLLAFLMVPVFKVVRSPDAPLRWVLVLSTLFGLINTGLLGRIAFRMSGYPAALAASAMWAFSPLAVSTSMDGLETSLALTMSLALTELWCRARACHRTAHFFAAGLFAGLALLARVDTIFLVGLLGAWEFARGRRKGALAAALAALLVVSPWWGYSISKFKTPVPESGAAVRVQVSYHQSSYLKPFQQVGWAVGTIAGSPFFDGKRLREWLTRQPAPSLFLGIFLATLLAAAVVWLYKKGKGVEPWLILTAHGGIIALFYTFYLPALWFFRRYLHQSQAVVALVIAFVLGELWQDRTNRKAAAIALTIFGLCLAAALFQSAVWVWSDPPTTPDVSLHGAKGYREVARDVLSLVPEKAVVGAFQSGALAYYAANRFAVVNLDGVVDGEAARATRNRQLGEYARSRGITYFADWPFNYRAFLFFGGETARRAQFRVVGNARLQGLDRTVVSQVIWNPPK
jgi:hypothetical protein